MVAKSYPKVDQMRIRGNEVFSVVRQKWVQLTPEERVRQEFLRVLVNEYGYALDQISEELEVTGRGSGHARADFVIWRSPQDKSDGKNPLYARLTGARFFVTHNSKETKYWRVIHERMPKELEEIENIPHAAASDKEVEELLARLKVFKEDEFADLLHQCHNVIRNRSRWLTQRKAT